MLKNFKLTSKTTLILTFDNIKMASFFLNSLAIIGTEFRDIIWIEDCNTLNIRKKSQFNSRLCPKQQGSKETELQKSKSTYGS